MSDLSKLQFRAKMLESQYAKACGRLEDEEGQAKAAKRMEYAAAEASAIIQHVAQEVQKTAHDGMAAMVTKCLHSVFGADAYDFGIEFERKRGRTEARLFFTRGGEEFHPRLGTGGGVVDVAAFALRLAALMLTKPALRRVIVCDEPFRAVHGDGNRQRLRELLEVLPEQLGCQVIMVTGLEWLRCGKIIEVG